MSSSIQTFGGMPFQFYNNQSSYWSYPQQYGSSSFQYYRTPSYWGSSVNNMSQGFGGNGYSYYNPYTKYGGSSPYYNSYYNRPAGMPWGGWASFPPYPYYGAPDIYIEDPPPIDDITPPSAEGETPSTPLPMRDYTRILQEADTKSYNDPNSTTGDGILEREELIEYQRNMQRKIALSDTAEQILVQLFGGIAGGISYIWNDIASQRKEEYQNRLNIATTMLNNFDRFANPSGASSSSSEDEVKSLSTIDTYDILAVAGFDSDPDNISIEDIEKKITVPAGEDSSAETVQAKIERLFPSTDLLTQIIKFFLKRLANLDQESVDAKDITDKLNTLARFLPTLQAPLNEVLLAIKPAQTAS